MRARRPQPLSPSRRPGFSLVEAIVAAAIVGLMLVASINLFGSAVRTRAADNDHRTALMLANQLISEIQQQPYKDENLTALLFGPELGETGSTRANFDDVDDYNGFQENPPRLKDGTILSGYETWTRKVTVAWVQPAGLGSALVDSGLVKIDVTVTDPKGRSTTVSALRSATMTGDAPPAGSTALLWTGVELNAGGDTPRQATGGVNLVSLPITP